MFELSDKNNRVFNNEEKSLSRLLYKLKHMSFWWLKTKIINISIGFYTAIGNVPLIVWGLVNCVMLVVSFEL